MSSYKDRQSADILNSVYKNAEMAYESSGDVLRRCKNARLYSEIAKQRERYKNISAEALGELQRRGVRAQQTPPAAKAMAKMGIAMQTMADTSSSHIAALMIRGTTRHNRYAADAQPLGGGRGGPAKRRASAPAQRAGLLRAP